MFEMIFAFSPMLSGYVFRGIGLDLVLLVIAGLITLKRQRGNIVIDNTNRDFVILFSYVLLKDVCIVLFGKSDSSESFHRFLSTATYIFFFFILLNRRFNHEKFYKGLKYAGGLYTAGLIYHLIIIYVFEIPARGISIIPGYQFSNVNMPERPRSFFSEPAALATAMLPLLFYSLHRKDYKWAMLATFTIFMSTSTTGVLLAAILWFLEFVIGTGKKKHKIMVIMTFMVAVIFLIKMEFTQDALLAVQNRLRGGGSTSIRVFLGFEVLKTLHPAQFIAGLLYNKPYDYAVMHMDLFSEGSFARGVISIGAGYFFINAFCSLLFRYGVIGMLLYLRVYKGKLFVKNYPGRAFAIMTIIQTIGDSMLFNSYYFYIMLILFYLAQKKETRYEGATYRIGIRKPNA